MSLAAETRAAVRAEPFLYDALRAGVCNYTAAARHLGVGDEEAVAAALRRYAADLPEPEPTARDARVTMQSGLGPTADPAEALLAVGDVALAPGAGSLTGVQATGDVDPAALGRVLRRLAVEDVAVEAAGASGRSSGATAADERRGDATGTLLVAVDRRAGADAVRLVEAALD